MNWFVTVLKLVGVVLAVLAVHPRLVAPGPSGHRCGRHSTVSLYGVGSITQAFVMLAGIADDASQVDAGSVAYVLAFMLAAAGFGILATSHARRAGLGSHQGDRCLRSALVLGSVLGILPAMLKAVGLLSASR